MLHLVVAFKCAYVAPIVEPLDDCDTFATAFVVVVVADTSMDVSLALQPLHPNLSVVKAVRGSGARRRPSLARESQGPFIIE